MAEGDFAEVRRKIAKIHGWLGDAEAEALYVAARACAGRGVIVEIGSWKGKSTICLAAGSRAGLGTTVYSVDLHRDKRYDKFTRNIERAGVQDLIRPIRSSSQDAAEGFEEPIEVLFVDGGHDEWEVNADFENWVPKVVPGGVVFVHDTVWHAGPRRLVGRELFRSRSFTDVRFVRPSMSVGKKVAENGLGDRLRARAQLAVKTSFWIASAPAQKARRHLPEGVLQFGRRLIGVSSRR